MRFGFFGSVFGCCLDQEELGMERVNTVETGIDETLSTANKILDEFKGDE